MYSDTGSSGGSRLNHVSQVLAPTVAEKSGTVGYMVYQGRRASQYLFRRYVCKA
ncbi:hypothetical protein ABH970_004009 [Bradyrhizobium ottawaense]